jgi:nitrate reductase gamma subunit
MPSVLPFLDEILFIVLPYVVFSLFFLVSIYRYLRMPFTFSSLSSQFLESREHFWGMVPFHYGIIFVLTGHVVAFLIPRGVLAWNRRPVRLYVLEFSALSFGLLAVVGLLSAIIRRMTDHKARRVTSPVDWITLLTLLGQMLGGVYVALFHPWGSSWFAALVSPYLWSLVQFHPDISYIALLPLGVRLHIVGAYLLIGLSPFTRLVHILVIPNPYLWRRPQVVRWYRRTPGVAA